MIALLYNALHFQISTSVPLAMVVVAKSVPTQLDHFSVAAIVATA